LAADLRVPVLDEDRWRSASLLIDRDPHDALPLVTLLGTLGTVVTPWTPRRDLLASSGTEAEFVVEVENDGRAVLRFGDDEHGLRPNEETSFSATYRVGNGTAGNVGAEAIAHVVIGVSGVITRVINLMPAAGGIDPEEIEAARRDAPQAFRTQERAGTAADYAA